LTVATGELTKKGVVPTPRSALQVVPGFLQQVSGFWFQRTFDPPELSYKILGDITQNMVRRQHKMGMTADQYIVDSFPQAMREELTTHMATGNELLHHIWTSYPLNFHTSSGESGSTKGCNVRNLQWNLGFQRPSTRSAVTYKTPEEETAIEKEYQYCFDSYSMTYEFIHTLQDSSNE